jgi:hypothetical protein
MLSALTNFAQGYDYTYTDPLTSTDAGGTSVTFMLVLIVIGLILTVITIAGLWKVFVKAGKPGWAAIVPIYNFYIFLQIVGRPTWWLLLLLLSFIPFVGSVAVLVVGIIVSHDLSKSFGKSTGMTVLQVILPFVAYPMLGFGDAKYQGPSVKPADGSTPAAPHADSTPPPATPAA